MFGMSFIYIRQWRKNIHSPDDIWTEIVKVTNLPGLTSAPKLQPIQTRLVMLSTGMRAPMGLKIFGSDLETIETAGLDFERLLKEAPGVVPSSVFYDRSVGAPYIEIKLNRQAISRYGMAVEDVQNVLQSAIGGMTLTTTVEGRERFPVRLRYPRELRTTPEELKKILVPSMGGTQIPLGELAELNYTRGPQMIRSENTFLNGYVIFDKQPGLAEVDVVENAQKYLNEKLSSGVFVAFAGGFIMLWLYGQGWFMNFSLAGINMRDLFQIHPINLSVAVWVGFIALFGIATDDGVIIQIMTMFVVPVL